MSDTIHHECGVAMIRLLKPLDYYREKYGTHHYGLDKLYLLMEKQHNRGQDGAGIATIKLDMPVGHKVIDIQKSTRVNAIKDIFETVFSSLENAPETADQLKLQHRFTGEVMMGHLRYGTHGRNNVFSVHPFIRENNWLTRNLVIAGNFNMVNNEELFHQLVALGQHPKEKTDTVTVLEKLGHFLDREVQMLFDQYKDYHDNRTISDLVASDLNVQNILARAARDFEGGYTILGMLGHGDAFVLRDPSGIRPAYYYQDDEVVVAASERPAIMTAFDVPFEEVRELTPGHALIIKKNGKTKEQLCRAPLEKRSCSFERIYFSRGGDKEIYEERKKLGKLITPKVLEAVHYDYEHTIFSFIPNTAEVAFYGMMKGLEDHLNHLKTEHIKSFKGAIDDVELERILSLRPRVEKLAIKDVKLRTFITNDSDRSNMVSHVYDVTYGQVASGVDTIVLIDDSIVRGTTLRQSIIAILDRLLPKKIIIVSSAPPICYPDCYGIDMSKMGDFVAFKAAIELTHARGNAALLDTVYRECKEMEHLPSDKVHNAVKKIYEQFTDEELAAQVSKIVKAPQIRAEVEVIYQTVDNLHAACPHNLGDWYFTGDYPTPGGNKVANKAFVNYMEGRDERAYS
ncbi:MAG TPA: amidophosphoribosyltransferase [Bacteroidetes bacterium]|nr:MAG: amidophosphoribosyltransferase [Sphingobacteriales bacterium BACL12 MAG-120813-bin55]HCK22468.1 amidophosphoribosyltransferase [Bacteroidota bacterium]